jgi:hypothetical protein
MLLVIDSQKGAQQYLRRQGKVKVLRRGFA